MRILAEQLNGETVDLEVTGEMTMRDVKMQIKRVHKWEDEMSRDTTVVEVILGDRKVTDEETVEELGLCDGSKVTVVFRKNLVQCSKKSGLGRDLDPEALVIVEIPDAETEIEEGAFEDCEEVAKVMIPSSVTQIGHAAFNGCSSLLTINIPDSVTEIGDYAFARCSSLVNVDIPNSVRQIGEYAFDRCSSLKAVNIPDSVTEIVDHGFAGCSALAAINIPDSVTYIGLYAFFGCSSLASINIPGSVTYIGAEAFSCCTSLTSVDIPDSVTEIRPAAFGCCTQLTLRAPARLLDRHVTDVRKVVAKECRCGRCDWTLFSEGWVCPKRHCGGQRQGPNVDGKGMKRALCIQYTVSIVYSLYLLMRLSLV